MPSKAAVLCALLSLALTGVYAADKPCTIREKGKFFDLTALKSSKDYHVTGGGPDIFPINACQGVRTETFGIKDESIKDDEIAAFVRRGHGDFVIGKVNTTLSVVDNRPRMILSEGSKCKTSQGETLNIRASTVVDFICDPGIFGPGQPRLVAQLPPGDDDAACGFVIEWKTHYACPIGEGGFIWSLFVFLAIAFLTLLMIYTVLGTLYNRYVLQLRGFDQIPQFSIESMKYHSSEALDWLKDIAANLDIPGNNNTAHSRSGSGGGGRPPWSASSGPRTPNPVSHQAQVLSAGVGGVQARSGGAYDEESAMEPPSAGAAAGFVRPGTGSRGTVHPTTATNPVSHQTQVIAEAQQRAMAAQQQESLAAASSLGVGPNIPTATTGTVSSAAPPTPPPKIQLGPAPAQRTKLEVRPATQAEREFMLGEDEEDDDDDDEEYEDEDDEEEERTPKREAAPSGAPHAQGSSGNDR